MEPAKKSRRSQVAGFVLAGILLGATLYTYPASRALPVAYLLFALCLPLAAAVVDFDHLWLPASYFDVIVNIYFLDRAALALYRQAHDHAALSQATREHRRDTRNGETL